MQAASPIMINSRIIHNIEFSIFLVLNLKFYCNNTKLVKRIREEIAILIFMVYILSFMVSKVGSC